MTPKEMLAYTAEMLETMKEIKSKAVFVGLPAEKVGEKIYGDGRSVIAIGATHEYGATYGHPGGTSYIIGEDGRVRFVPKGTAGAKVTKPHTITIPQRSFLRAPFDTKRKEMDEGIAKQFHAAVNGLISVDTGLGRVGVLATNISKGAFTTRGYGTWPDIRAATKKRKGSDQVLIDTGILRSSITWVIRNAS